MNTGPRRSGFVSVIGAPNVGKSTLINYLVGTKVSIVSPKVQTTRTQILGICIADNSQIVFIDTPGIFEPKRRLDRAMVAAAWNGTKDADLVLLLIDAKRGIDRNTRQIINQSTKNSERVILAFNKIDLINKQDLLSMTSKVQNLNTFDHIFMISAILGDGIDDLLDRLKSLIPAGPWLFPADQVTDTPEHLLAAEITREKLYLELQRELPYATTVEAESWENKPDGSIRISQIIYVERDTQKSIVLGKAGRQIKRIGADSRKELESIFGKTVHLFLFVKVRSRWSEDPERYRDLNLDFNA